MSIKLAVPNKGRLNERSIEILKQAGLEIEDGGERKLFATVKNRDLSIMFLRAQDIVRFVNRGAVDMGITGWDLVLESGLDVMKMSDLNYGRCRLAVAVPDSSNIETVDDIPDGSVVEPLSPTWPKNSSRTKERKLISPLYRAQQRSRRTSVYLIL